MWIKQISSTETDVAIYPFAISATIAPILVFLHLGNKSCLPQDRLD